VERGVGFENWSFSAGWWQWWAGCSYRAGDAHGLDFAVVLRERHHRELAARFGVWCFKFAIYIYIYIKSRDPNP
jgi:hypothetical protein